MGAGGFRVNPLNVRWVSTLGSLLSVALYRPPSINYTAMILLKNYFVNTTEEVDVMTVIHEVNRTIREANATEGAVTITVPESGAALAIVQPLDDIVEQL